MRASLALAVLLGVAGGALAAPASPAWVASWGEALAPAKPDLKIKLDHATFRMVAHLSVGGGQARVTISNVFGHGKLVLGAVHLGRPAPGGAITPGSDVPLQFGGAASAVIPAGAAWTTDPVPYPTVAGEDLAVSLYIVSSDGMSQHFEAMATGFLLAGNHAGDATLPGAALRSDRMFLDGIDVLTPTGGSAVVTLGDSITDGTGTLPNANSRWPDFLAARLVAHGGLPVGVVNAGIAGDTVTVPGGILPPAVTRLDRDVFDRTGARIVVLLEGINDCAETKAPEATATAVITAMRRIIKKSHAAGMRIFGATVMPSAGNLFATPAGETCRLTINRFIRANAMHAGADAAVRFDKIIDTDAAMRDPAQPDHLLPIYDSGDHIHPNAAGAAAIADLVFRSVVGR